VGENFFRSQTFFDFIFLIDSTRHAVCKTALRSRGCSSGKWCKRGAKVHPLTQLGCTPPVGLFKARRAALLGALERVADG
jgi:hypothetical protein